MTIKDIAMPNNDNPPDKKSPAYRLITIQLLYTPEILDLQKASDFIDVITDTCQQLNTFGMATVTGDIPITNPDETLNTLIQNEIVFQFLEDSQEL